MRGRLLAAALLAVACRPVEDPPDGASSTPRVTVRAPRPNEGTPAPAPAVALPDFAAVAARMRPSVVAVISTVRTNDQVTGTRVMRGIGAGMIVSANGQIITNEHVVASADEVSVELASHEQVSAHVLARDALLDLALLQLDVEVEDLQPVSFRGSPATPGEWIMAVGQPYGLGNTVTVGVVSGLGRDYADLGRPKGLRPDGIWSFIQTDASINIGNSGGPLVDPSGAVVGITTAVRRDGQGLAFAIPGEMARRFIDEYWTHGRMRHPRLGIRADNVGPDTFPGRASAVRVTKVDPGGPAAVAGVVPGDIVLAIDDRPVVRVSEVAYLTQLRGVGASLNLTIKRGEDPVERVVLVPDEAR